MKKELILFFPIFYLYLLIFSLTWKSCSFWKRRLTDVEEKVSTYLSIICIADKKKRQNLQVSQ